MTELVKTINVSGNPYYNPETWGLAIITEE